MTEKFQRAIVALDAAHAEDPEKDASGAPKELLGHAGYDAEAVKRVQSLIKKERIKHDPEAQLLEDVACLVFLENELADFAARHEEVKIVDILRKTWGKMSPQGQAAALGLILPAPLRALIEQALAVRP